MSLTIGQFCYGVVFIYFGFILISMIIQTNRTYRRFRTFNNEQIQTMIVLMIILFLTLIICVNFLDIDDAKFKLQIAHIGLILLVAGIPLFLIVIMALTNLIQYSRQYPKFLRHGTELSLRPQSKRAKMLLDRSRKLFHVILLVILIIFELGVGKYLSGFEYWDMSMFWGNYDGSNIITQLFEVESEFAIGQIFILGVFYGMTCTTLMFEATRLSDHIHFPLIAQLQRTSRNKELNTYASHTHSAIGYLLASLLLPPNCFLAALSIFSFGDTYAAIIGIRWGKHKIQNQNKTWEGTIAGFVISLITSSLFVGPIWGLLAALLFVVIDLLTPNIIKISDNILIPVACIFLFFILKLLNIPASFPIATFFNII